MSLRARLLLMSMLTSAPLVGCKKEEAPAAPPVHRAEPKATAEAAPEPAAPVERATPACAAAPASGTAESLELAGRKATRTGTTLSFADADADGALVLGVLGPINEDSGANRLALRKYNAFFKEQGVDAIVVTGDVGEVASGIAGALGEVAAAGKPVFVIAGNRECEADYVEGVKAAQEKHPAIVDLNAVREVRFPEATLVSIPGYHDPDFINCESGCRYYPSTVDEAITLAKAAKSPVVLVAHGPPAGKGSQSLDYAKTGSNVGAEEISRALREGGIPFGVFSNIKEAGARATDLAGTTIIPQGQEVSSLFLNPGPADTTDWGMNDRSVGHGFAATLRIKDGKASWKLFRAGPITGAERKQAKALEAP